MFMRSMIKRTIIAMGLCFLLMLSSCADESLQMHDEIKSTAEHAMTLFANKELNELIKLFSKDIQENRKDETIAEIEKIYDFFDGEIISYEFDSEGGVEAKKSDGKVYYYDCFLRFNAETDNGTVYKIRFTYHYIWDEKPEYEGICKIKVTEKENSDNKIEAGITYYE